MAYGSSSYGSAPYGGSVPSGKVTSLPLKYTVLTTSTPLTLSLQYRVGVLRSESLSLQYAVIASHSTALSLQYVVRPTFSLPLKYTVLTTSTPLTLSDQYAVGVRYTITESIRYTIGVKNTIPLDLKYTIQWTPANLTLPLQYVVIPTITDSPDYSKGVVVAEYVADDQILWNAYSASANETTASLDVSAAGSLQVYVQTDSATTIYLQILTADGWINYPTGNSLVFSGSGSTFYPIWFLTFTQVRFQTTAAAKLTIECFIRT